MDSQDIIRTLRIDPRLESYRPSLDKAKMIETEEIASQSPRLSRFISDLWLEWVSAAHVVSLPYYGVLIAETFVKSLKETRLESQPQVQLVKYLMAHLSNHVVLDSKTTADLQQTLANLYNEWLLRDAEVPFPREDMWDAFIHEQCDEGREFALSVWASERLTYASVYYAYEHFLVKCAQVRLPGERLRATNQDWPKRFREAFDESLLSHCWSSPQIYLAREIRNSIVHVGGRITKALEGREKEHEIVIVDDHLQIFPRDIKHLHLALGDPVQRLVKYAVHLPEFTT